jgi:hypothetical protein
LQLRVWKKALEYLPKDSKFIMMGTCRGIDDEKIVSDLQQLAIDLKIEKTIEF